MSHSTYPAISDLLDDCFLSSCDKVSADLDPVVKSDAPATTVIPVEEAPRPFDSLPTVHKNDMTAPPRLVPDAELYHPPILESQVMPTKQPPPAVVHQMEGVASPGAASPSTARDIDDRKPWLAGLRAKSAFDNDNDNDDLDLSLPAARSDAAASSLELAESIEREVQQVLARYRASAGAATVAPLGSNDVDEDDAPDDELRAAVLAKKAIGRID